MERKTIFYIVGAVAVIGIGYYLWNKNKKAGEEKTEGEEKEEAEVVKEETDANAKSKIAIKKPIDAIKDAVKSVQSNVKKLTAQELESKLQSTCGKKPLLKKNKIKWEQCRTDYTNKLRSQGLISFDGTSESIVDNGFYSSFDNTLDLDL
jgi:Tfp pilus assembly protein PilO